MRWIGDQAQSYSHQWAEPQNYWNIHIAKKKQKQKRKKKSRKILSSRSEKEKKTRRWTLKYNNRHLKRRKRSIRNALVSACARTPNGIWNILLKNSRTHIKLLSDCAWAGCVFTRTFFFLLHLLCGHLTALIFIVIYENDL